MVTESTTYIANMIGHEDVGDGTKAFSFRRPAGFQFKAGQYIDVTLLDPPQTDAEGNTRTFSLVNPPSAKHADDCHSHTRHCIQACSGISSVRIVREHQGPDGLFLFAEGRITSNHPVGRRHWHHAIHEHHR